jgi:hypothetical protein
MKQLETLSTLGVGSVLRRTDLHVHTPASKDMDSHWNKATADDVVALALNAELDVIAVTDHNTAAWCDEVRAAAEDTELTVFPGVEVSTSEGHLLAIFDVNKPQAEIEDFLTRIGIRRKDFGKLDKIADGRIDDIARAVEDEGGMAIAAHVEREKGFWEMMDSSRTRRKEVHACDDISAYEVVDPELRTQFQEGSLDGYGRRVACVQGSDCFPVDGDSHQLDAIGRRHCYVAFDNPSLTGLRLACLDPDVRIRFMEDDRPEPESAIEGLWVSGGFLDDQVFRFSDNITCLIGDTGTGKSLTLELMRYALEQQIDQTVLPKIAEEVLDLLDDNLEMLDTVHVVIRKGDESYLIERPWLGEGSPPSPTVSRIVDGRPEALEEPIHLPTFFPIKGFSQTEIIEYAREPLARLSLIDDLLDLSAESTEIEETKGLLRENAAQTNTQLGLLEKTKKRLKNLPGVQEEIKRLEAFLTNEAVRSHGAWDTERSVLDGAAEAIQDLEESVSGGFPELDGTLVHEDDFDEDTPTTDLEEQLTALEAEVQAALAKSQEGLIAVIKSLRRKLEKIRATWDARFEEADKKYQELVAELETTERSQAKLQGTLTSLRAKGRSLRQAKRKIRDEIRPLLKRLEAERDELLDVLQKARKAIRAKRRRKAKELTEALYKNVLVRIRAEKDERMFHERLLDLRTGSRVQESDLDLMAEQLHPIPFVKSILVGDTVAPAEKAGLSDETIERFTTNVMEKGRLDDLFELQLVDLPDVVEVQFALESGEYKDLERLAHGQKCTAVLMIALAEGGFPLLVDQPEDALHAPWIENYIATTLRSRRGTRQCLFATRSANVLVSADAEQIIAMKADAERGTIDKTGALDRFETRDLVLYHVEGGEEPLRRRLQKYGLDLSG